MELFIDQFEEITQTYNFISEVYEEDLQSLFFQLD